MGRSKLSIEIARKIRADKRSATVVATTYGTTPQNVIAIRTGKSWKDANDTAATKPNPHRSTWAWNTGEPSIFLEGADRGHYTGRQFGPKKNNFLEKKPDFTSYSKA